MRIVICEDDTRDRELLCRLLDTAAAKLRVDIQLASFATGGDMLAALEQQNFSAAFLDIYMQDTSGIALAYRLREKGSPAIVFTTISEDHRAEGFDVGAVHYLVKPFGEREVEIALERCLRYTGGAEKYVEFTIKRVPRKVYLAHILYVESQDKYCIVHTSSGALRLLMRLDEMEQTLADGSFLRCHRSFIVNLQHVARADTADFVLADGSRVPLRRQNRQQHKERYAEFLFSRQRARP